MNWFGSPDGRGNKRGPRGHFWGGEAIKRASNVDLTTGSALISPFSDSSDFMVAVNLPSVRGKHTQMSFSHHGETLIGCRLTRVCRGHENSISHACSHVRRNGNWFFSGRALFCFGQWCSHGDSRTYCLEIKCPLSLYVPVSACE